MFESQIDQLSNLISNEAFGIQQALIQKTGSNYIEATKTERARFEPPPLINPTLPDAGRLLYGNAATVNEIINAWNIIAASVVFRGDSDSVVREARHVFPRLPVLGNTVDIAVRFIEAVSWLGFDYKLSPSRITVEVDGITLGFNGSHIHGTMVRRIPPVKIPDIKEILNRPTGRSYLAVSKTTAIYRSLMLALPDQKKEIHELARIATHGGKPCWLAFIEPFDAVIINTPIKRGSKDVRVKGRGLWFDAYRVVNGSTINPVPELFRMLSAHIEYHDFVRIFGNPYRHGTKFTPRAKIKLIDAISKLELATSPDSQAVTGLALLSDQATIANINV